MKDYKELAKRAVSSDEAFEELYRIFYPRMYNYIFGRLKDSSLADDVASEVFLKVYLSIGSYRGESSFSTWVTAIARQEMARAWQKAGRRQEVTWEEFFALEDAEENRPEARVLEREGKRDLLESLDSLDDRGRCVVELKYFAGLSQQEIARLLGLTQSNVGVILHRSLEKMRKIMFCHRKGFLAAEKK